MMAMVEKRVVVGIGSFVIVVVKVRRVKAR
jgi:hypothetical protein